MLHRQFQPDIILEPSRYFFDVFEGSAFDHAPLWTLIYAQHSVVFKKTDEIARRKGIHPALSRGPDRRPHWNNVIPDERL